MSLRPSKLIAGDRIVYQGALAAPAGEFVCRIPRSAQQRVATNVVRFAQHAGLNGPHDLGDCQISDYDLSRKASRA